VILGEGPLRGDLEALIVSYGLEGDVILPGFVSDPWAFYETAQVFALSSQYEGFPLVLIEAMRAGLSIVSTDCESGPREILAGDDYGQLVPPGDTDALARAMARALDDPTDAQLLRERAEVLSGQNVSDLYVRYMTH
jgi:glycosyltransferase involved in cell wall biosynthesis